MNTGLENKIVFVSGSTRGIGKAVAASFLDEDATVIITGRTKKRLEGTVKEFSNRYGKDKVLGIQCDLTSTTAIRRVIDRVLRKSQHIDVLVCNIGGTAVPGWKQGDKEWNRVIENNFMNNVRLTEAVLPDMISRKQGNIIYVSSIAALETIGAPVTYTASKAAIAAISKVHAADLAQYNIRVNHIAPGNVLFKGGAWEKKLKKNKRAVMAGIKSRVPMKRFGKPEEIGGAAVFLASDQASFITGACIVVDGGQTSRIM